MDKEEFSELVLSLNERDSERVLAYLSGYYGENEEFKKAVLKAINVVTDLKKY